MTALSPRELFLWSTTLATFAVACSGDSVRLGADPNGGPRAVGGGPGVGGSNPFAGSGAGSPAGTSAGGVGGAVGSGASAGLAGSCSTADAGWCAEDVTRHGDWRADVLMLVDTSPSMAEEVPEVQAALNAFAERIQAAQVDLRLVLIAAPPTAEASGPSICVPPPLGSGSCAPQSDDTVWPKFFHEPLAAFNERTDLVELLRITAGRYATILRPDVRTAMVIVSDSDAPSELESSYWNSDFIPTFNQTKYSALYAFSRCPGSRAAGTVYRTLVRATGGAQGDLCSEPIASSLGRVADEVVAQQICETPLPPNSASIDWSNVRVVITSNGAPAEVSYVRSPEACDPLRGGWYEVPRNPEGHHRRLCPATCAAFRADQNSTVATQLACQRPPIPC